MSKTDQLSLKLTVTVKLSRLSLEMTCITNMHSLCESHIELMYQLESIIYLKLEEKKLHCLGNCYRSYFLPKLELLKTMFSFTYNSFLLVEQIVLQ